MNAVMDELYKAGFCTTFRSARRRVAQVQSANAIGSILKLATGKGRLIDLYGRSAGLSGKTTGDNQTVLPLERIKTVRQIVPVFLGEGNRSRPARKQLGAVISISGSIGCADTSAALYWSSL